MRFVASFPAPRARRVEERMIDEEMRRMVFRLREKGRGTRAIAKALGISRTSVKSILEAGSPQLPECVRERWLDEHLEVIRELYVGCDRSVTRVAEELEKLLKIAVPYSTLTAFCRHHGLGAPLEEPQPVGKYKTGMGVEMQHDTSPIELKVGSVHRLYQGASLKFGYSRVRYLRFYRRFTRFHCKCFLTRGFGFFRGTCGRCVIDNTSVVISHGTGVDAVAAPEMDAFRKRFNFTWLAHELGDANRSAKVERDFDYIQRNFVKGRTFVSDDDLNAQAEEWCHQKNAGYIRSLRIYPVRLFMEEQVHLNPLPEYIPPVYRIHHRKVDPEGFVTLDGNLYSAPNKVLEKTLTLRETMEEVVLLEGHEELCRHPRFPEDERGISKLDGHGRKPRARHVPREITPEEKWLVDKSEDFKAYVTGIKKRGRRRSLHQVRRLYDLCHEYDVVDVERAVKRASEYNLFDTTRLESMLLQELGAKLFGTPRRTSNESPEGRVSPVKKAAAPEGHAPHESDPKTGVDVGIPGDDEEEKGDE